MLQPLWCGVGRTLCRGSFSHLRGSIFETLRRSRLNGSIFSSQTGCKTWIREQISTSARRSSLGRLSSRIYDLSGDLWLSVKGNSVPRNANFPLLKSWKQVADVGLPILLLKAPGLKASGVKPRQGEFDYSVILRAWQRERGGSQ